MLATNRYADVDAQLDTRLLEGFRRDNDVGNYEYYDNEEEEEDDDEEEGGSVEPREITDSVGRNSVGKDKTDFGEAKRPVHSPCMIVDRVSISNPACSFQSRLGGKRFRGENSTLGLLY